MFDAAVKRLFFALIPLLLCLFLSGCSAKTESRELFAMDTVMELSASGENAPAALDAAEAEIARLDRLLSAENETGEVWALNESVGGIMSTDTAYVVSRALEINAASGGAFDITLLPLSRAWGFYSDEKRVPDGAELSGLLSLTGSDKLSVSGDTLVYGADGLQIDLGGIAKGYASGRVVDILRENGVESAIISLGGNVQTLGKKPDGSLWRVAVQSPFEGEAHIGVVSCADAALVTSGGYQRYFEENGVRYHHILDPKTGRPSDSGLASVTIVSSDPTLADGLSTALFVMGLEDSVEFWRSGAFEFEAVLVTDEGEILITSGLDGFFSSECAFEVISK